MSRNLHQTLIVAEIKQMVQKRLSLPECWETHTTKLETWSNGKKVWNLSWRVPDEGSEVYFWVCVDAASGEILDLLHGIPRAKEVSWHEWCSREDAIAIARRFIEQANPGKAQYVELHAVHTQSDCYRLFFRRLVKGIPFDTDGYEITVEPVTRQVRDLHFTWSDICFPPWDNVITLEEARKSFINQFPFQLSYYVGTSQQVRLVYAPAYASFFSIEPYWQIDALTGCLIDTFGTNMDAAAIKRNLLKPDKGVVPCSVPGTGLNRDEALNRGRKIIGFLNWPYEVVQVKKATWDSQNGSGVDLWELRFAGELGEAHIRLDRGNGEVWFINCDFNDTLECATIPSLENLESDAHLLLEICLPHRVGRMVHLECALSDARWSQAYTYMETVNGIPVLNNQVTITLCGNTGRLQSLNRHWLASDTFFPDPQAELKLNVAARRYLEIFGLELAYVHNNWSDPSRAQAAARLVYRVKPVVLPDFSFPVGRLFIDARTGERL